MVEAKQRVRVLWNTLLSCGTKWNRVEPVGKMPRFSAISFSLGLYLYILAMLFH